MTWDAAIETAYATWRKLINAIDPSCPTLVYYAPGRRAFVVQGSAAYLKRFTGLPPKVGKIPVLFVLVEDCQQIEFRWDDLREGAELVERIG